MNRIDKQYQALLQDILDNGVEKQDRTGTGTKSIFGYTIRHKMSDGFPLLTTKKMYFKGICVELLWFLRGDISIEYLLKNDCNIWTGDAYQSYLKECEKLKKEEFVEKIKTDKKFAERFGNLGKIYGYQWRNWNGEIDQISELIKQIKENPDSRRLLVSAWNASDLPHQVLPPCHYGFQVYTRELSKSERYVHLRTGKYSGKWDGTGDEMEYYNSIGVPKRAISLMWNQRSVDVGLGLPFNIASYGLLLEIIAKITNMVPDELIGSLGDTHLYSNHIEPIKEQIGRELSLEERKKIFEDRGYVCDVWPFNGNWDGEYDGFGIPRRTREPFELPKLVHMKTDDFYKSLSEDLSLLSHLDNKDFTLENYQSHPTIKLPLSN